MPNEQYTFVTYFDVNYLVRGLTMVESVKKYEGSRIVTWIVLVLDDESYDATKQFLTSADRVVRIDEYADLELLSLKSSRPYREFCWSIASSLLNFAVSTAAADTIVTYIDSDCFFFSNPFDFIDTALSNHDIAIHDHDFSINRESQEKAFGKYNVGVITGRVSKDYRDCIAKWRLQVISKCEINLTDGLFGDQKYLDTWPIDFESVSIINNPGAGRAPWNISDKEIALTSTGVTTNSHPLIFFHFHGFRLVPIWRNLFFCTPALSYRFNSDITKIIYEIYANRLVQNRYKLNTNARMTQGFSGTRESLIALRNSSKLLLKMRVKADD